MLVSMVLVFEEENFGILFVFLMCYFYLIYLFDYMIFFQLNVIFHFPFKVFIIIFLFTDFFKKSFTAIFNLLLKSILKL